MCLLLFYVNPDAGPDDIYLVLVSVRDEIFDRPTKLAEFWKEHPHVIGGTDQEPGKEGGTWLAMSKSGKIGVLLNILQPDDDILPDKKGRGFLAADYVVQEANYIEYLKNLSTEGKNYNEFLLVTMDYSSLKAPKIACYTNSSPSVPLVLGPGFHAFGNSITPNNPWPKVSKAKEDFCKVVQRFPTISTKTELVKELLQLLRNPTRYPPDENMKIQGRTKSIEFLDKLCAIFVNIPESNYGSRCHTVILVDGARNVDYYESSRPENLTPESVQEWETNHHTFKLLENLS
ncbi:hypothetical protein JTE90_018967 [Oedothorax gibbosus]|uniref:Uncharacterized protein n=1 Tax=Oedothorax gibbosus TaxID=931172 RepID=A0AAV6V167_9ARAC|nr:hypothetical protein JTE90_018967 [Oedothorax gibbosus]